MKVKELIISLSQYDPDLEVKVPTNEILLSDVKDTLLRHGQFVEIYVSENIMETNEELVDKIANFFEKEDNWSALKNCWLENGRSDDLRKLLHKAIKEKY